MGEKLSGILALVGRVMSLFIGAKQTMAGGEFAKVNLEAARSHKGASPDLLDGSSYVSLGQTYLTSYLRQTPTFTNQQINLISIHTLFLNKR